VDGTTFVELPRFIRVYPLEILKRAKRSTSTPVNLKNRLAKVPERYEVRPPTPSSPGVVHRANVIIVSAQITKLPVVIAYACMTRVNPQGRKKVNAPVLIAAICFDTPPLFAISARKNFGRVIDIRDNRGEISASFIPRTSIIIPVIPVSIPIKKGERDIKAPNIPSNPPNIPKPIMRPILKYKCGSNLCHFEAFRCSSFHLALTASVSHPTKAMQLDIPAVNPTRNATPKVGDEI